MKTWTLTLVLSLSLVCSTVFAGDDNVASGAVGPFRATNSFREGTNEDCADTWTATTTANAPVARDGHTAVWTGGEMIVWGGENVSGIMINTGGRYNPATDSWIATSIVDAPTTRWHHTAVWTGSEMIIWGGGGNGFANTGGKYNPVTDSWTATSTVDAPAARMFHTAIWTGKEMVVWGGYDNTQRFNSGGRYNPETDSWTPISITNVASERWGHTAIWTGSEMIVWGGTNPGVDNYLNTGGKYNPATDSWAPTNLANAADARIFHTAVWTGSEMIVWGGSNAASNFMFAGGRYNPVSDSWIATNPGNTPLARGGHTAVWTGSEMIIWGGSTPVGDTSTGGRYDPGSNLWTPTTTTSAPSQREFQTAIWTGNEMIVWGGLLGGPTMNTGGRYCAGQSTTPTPTPTATPLSTPVSTATPSPSSTATPSPTPTPSPSATTAPTPTPSPGPTSQLVNLSTRMRVQTGDNIGIGGFIITGNAPKHVLLRALGPSLAGFGVPDALEDPTLELHGSGSFVTITDDNWRDDPAQESSIIGTGIPPFHDLEPAIDATLNPGAYTAIVKGKNSASGIALVEVYDLGQEIPARLANISTRALVGAGDDIVIAGFVLGNKNSYDQIVVRGIGPSLTGLGVPNALANPILELRNNDGMLLLTNNDWQDDPAQADEISATGLAPIDDLESGIAMTLPPGPYTALLAGLGGGTGVGIVEVYDREAR